MTLTHEKLKTAVKQLASKLYSSDKTPISDDAKAFLSLIKLYKGEQVFLNGSLLNTNLAVLSVFDDAEIRSEVFLRNDDSSNYLEVYADSAGTNKICSLDPKDSISFPLSFNQHIYIKASASPLNYTAWKYVINV